MTFFLAFQFYYDHDSVLELKKLNTELFNDAEAQWDLSIDSLKEVGAFLFSRNLSWFA